MFWAQVHRPKLLRWDKRLWKRINEFIKKICFEDWLNLFYTFFCFNCVCRCSFDTPGLVGWAREGWLYIWTWLLALYGGLYLDLFLFLKDSGSDLCLISADMMLFCRWSLILGAEVWFLIWFLCCGVGQGKGVQGCCCGAHFYQDWSLEKKSGEREFVSDIVFGFYLCFILTSWSVFVRHTFFLPERMY